MSEGNRKGSALVVTMLILVILTAAGLYAVGLSTSGIESASVSEREQEARNAAEAGLFYGIDRFPFLARERGIRLPNGARYDVTVSHTGTVPVPGYDMGWAQALFRVRAVGIPANETRIREAAEAEAAFGPVPSGTEPVDRDLAPYRSAGIRVGPPSPFYHDFHDPSARSAFVRRYAGRKRVLLEGTGARTLRVVDAGSGIRENAANVADAAAEAQGAEPAVSDIRTSNPAASGGGSPDTGWRTIAVVAGRGEEGGYSTFDVTDPGSPRYPVLLWEITKRQVPILGRTRSTPAIGKVRVMPGRSEAPGETIERWVILVGGEKGILVLEAATGRILQLLSYPGMGEVYSSPAIALDREGYIQRAYAGDLSGNLWRATVTEGGRFDLGGGPLFSVTRGEVARGISGRCAIVPGEGEYSGLWIYFGTGDLEELPERRTGALFALLDGPESGGEGMAQTRRFTERDLVDATRYFARIHDPDAAFPSMKGTPSRGWYAILPTAGERILSGPRVFFSHLFLASYQADGTGPGKEGTRRVYGLGVAPGKNLGIPALGEGVGSSAAAAEPVPLSSRVRSGGVGGIPDSPDIMIGVGDHAHLSVRSDDGQLRVFRVPSPKRMKSVRFWKNLQPRAWTED